MSTNANQVTDTALLIPFARQQSQEHSIWNMGWLITLLATGKDTQGSFTLVEVSSTPGTEPPPHIQHNEDEMFYVVEGELTFQIADQVVKATPGTSVFLPRGIQHSFKIDSDQVKALVLLAPAGFEGFFTELGEPAQTLTIPAMPESLDMEKIIAVSAKYGVEYVLPPPP